MIKLTFNPRVYPQSPAVTAPVGHAAPLLSAGTCAASVPSGNLADAPVRPCRAFPSISVLSVDVRYDIVEGASDGDKVRYLGIPGYGVDA